MSYPISIEVAAVVPATCRDFLAAQAAHLDAAFASDCRRLALHYGPEETVYLVDLEQLQVHAELVRSAFWLARSNGILSRRQSICRWMTAETLLEFRAAQRRDAA